MKFQKFYHTNVKSLTNGRKGVQISWSEKIIAFIERIKELEKEFDLVLFSEMFDESMVLLANKLCWPLDYVKSFKLNARKDAYKVWRNSA